MTLNLTSFRRGVSGNPGGRPATAEVSALARRYTADWLRGLVGVVRLPVCRENAASIVAAARELREVGYPGLTKAAPDIGPTSLHLHLLAVTQEGHATLQSLPGGPGAASGVLIDADADAPPGGALEGWDTAEPWERERLPLGETYLPAPDELMPHEALPLWDAAVAAGAEDNGAETGGETDDGDASRRGD